VNNRKKLLALFGLKWNPFLSDIPAGELWHTPGNALGKYKKDF